MPKESIMAIKRICDKCGKETKGALLRIRPILVTPEEVYDGQTLEETKLDLCDNCLKRIKREANEPDAQLVES